MAIKIQYASDPKCRNVELVFKEMQRFGELKSSNSPKIRQKNSLEAGN